MIYENVYSRLYFTYSNLADIVLNKKKKPKRELGK